MGGRAPNSEPSCHVNSNKISLQEVGGRGPEKPSHLLLYAPSRNSMACTAHAQCFTAHVLYACACGHYVSTHHIPLVLRPELPEHWAHSSINCVQCCKLNSIYYTVPWLYLAPLDSTQLYYTLSCLYLALLDSTQLYCTLPRLYLTLLDPTTLYHGSTWLYLTLLHSTTALLSSTGLYLTLLHSTMPLLGSI